jgi:hypothetical protein
MSFDPFDERLYTLKENIDSVQITKIFQAGNLSGQIMTLESAIDSLKANIDFIRKDSDNRQGPYVLNNLNTIKNSVKKIEAILRQAQAIDEDYDDELNKEHRRNMLNHT